MNRLQKLILWVGVLAIVGMCLFPPQQATGKYGKLDIHVPMGYQFLCFQANTPGTTATKTTSIDTTRLVIQCFIVALLTGAGIATAKKSRKGNSDAGQD